MELSMEVIADLVAEVEGSMRDIGFAESYIASFGGTWNAFDRWLAERGLAYEPSLGRRFLLEEYGINDLGRYSKTAMEQKRKRAMVVLENCHEHRPYRRVEDRRYSPRFREEHAAVLNAFLESVEGSYSGSTVCGYIHMMNRLSPYLAERGVDDLGSIDQAAVVGFVESVAASGVGQGLIYATACRVRKLLAWLELSGIVERGLSNSVPKVKAPQADPPDVYTDEEVEMVIGAVDTAGPTGKRDLVVCLLAARLGMRSSDIADLQFGNIEWRESRISFVTAKTGSPTVLPLTNEVGSAIIAYLEGGRPESDEPYVLLRHNRPYTRMRPSRVYDIVSRAMTRAGIPNDGRRRGPHALRASVATRMLRNDVPLPVISRTLSHESSETTAKSYLKVELEHLRRCALDVDPLVNTWWMAGGAR